MHFAVDLPHFGPFSNPHLVAELAHEAEDAGWDGFFLWDHLNYRQAGLPDPLAVADPWMLLAAIALRTRSIKLGPMVTPLPRRRPWKLARETVTLDHLSWIAGNWPYKKPFRRAAQFDGVFPQMHERALTPEDYPELLGYTYAQRTQTTPFDVVAGGLTSGTDKAQDAERVGAFAQAGATWWLESFDPIQTFEQVRQRIHQGPPRF